MIMMAEGCVTEALGKRGVASVLMDERNWWQKLKHHISYKQISQHLLVGHQAWITSVMEKACALGYDTIVI